MNLSDLVPRVVRPLDKAPAKTFVRETRRKELTPEQIKLRGASIDKSKKRHGLRKKIISAKARLERTQIQLERLTKELESLG